jgi:hypothetical protein
MFIDKGGTSYSVKLGGTCSSSEETEADQRGTSLIVADRACGPVMWVVPARKILIQVMTGPPTAV